MSEHPETVWCWQCETRIARTALRRNPARASWCCPVCATDLRHERMVPVGGADAALQQAVAGIAGLIAGYEQAANQPGSAQERAQARASADGARAALQIVRQAFGDAGQEPDT